MVFLVEYDGSRFQGYQIQPGVSTVQGEFERALSDTLRQPIRVVAAGRTDRGVHALGQVIACESDTRMPLGAIEDGMRARLTTGIRVRSMKYGPAGFHPRFHAIRRAYRYVVSETLPPSAFLDPYVTILPRPVDWGRVREAAARLLGTHHFIHFSKRPKQAVRPERTMERLDITRQGDFVFLDFEARAFLRGMIRIMVGWLLAVGEGAAGPERIDELLASPTKGEGIKPAPPQGLYLTRVWYPDVIVPRRKAAPGEDELD